MGVGIAGLFYRLDTRIDRLDSHVRAQGGRLARLEGKVDALTGSVEALIAAFVKPSGGRPDAGGTGWRPDVSQTQGGSWHA